ncbi:putative diatom spindle kinesin 1 protein [Eutypa lata UCREL1]|uniref:Putative diatom spindle kinesin 1 protein n=1 Tax=Eutypa lata (strain UCR-EL1) TaxID=1287681 RepID=M7T2N1_EUTLA|nr:putative diatom spindle kinesin 1 protein [Eutypa lata UCREL1]
MDESPASDTQLYLKLVESFNPPEPKTNQTAGGEEKPIVIAARIRPTLKEEVSEGAVTSTFPRKDQGVLDVHELRKNVRGKAVLNSSSYVLDKIYTSSDTTEEVYNDLVHPLVPWAWSGGVSTIFAYGQTGSGKTYTVSGLERSIASDLFPPTEAGIRNIFVSIVELAGNTATDLLSARKPVSILEDSYGTTHLAGASEYHAVDRDALVGHIDRAAVLRQTAATQKNDASSRSHSVCRIRVANPSLPQAEDGLLFVVDLAGSEAARDDCIRGSANLDGLGGGAMKTATTSAAGRNNKAYVPFRQAALTKLLKHVFAPRYQKHFEVRPDVEDRQAKDSAAEVRSGEAGYVVKRAASRLDYKERKQLLQLPGPEFITRCLKTPDVSKDQAIAFQAKYWKLHIDSQHCRAPTSESQLQGGSGAGEKPDGDSAIPARWQDSSREPRMEMQALPFKDRLRPGMMVAWTPDEENAGFPVIPNGRDLIMLLSEEPCSSAGESSMAAAEADAKVKEKAERPRTYRCAFVGPAVMPGAFELHPWIQCVVEGSQMDAEVILEYDSATRYYYEIL